MIKAKTNETNVIFRTRASRQFCIVSLNLRIYIQVSNDPHVIRLRAVLVHDWLSRDRPPHHKIPGQCFQGLPFRLMKGEVKVPQSCSAA